MARKQTLLDLLLQIDAARERGNLSSAIRLFALAHYKKIAGDRPPAAPVE